MKKTLLMTAALALASAPLCAVTVAYDFETDQSGSFTSVEFGGPDSIVNYQYDYSADSIAAGPSGTGTTGLQVQVNTSIGAGNSVTFYPDTTGLDVADGTWQLTFDFYGKLGDDTGATTEFFGFGAQASTSNIGVGSDGADGFNYIATVDGGSSNDYRYASGSGGTMTGDNTIPNWWGTGAVNNLDADWAAFFTNPPYTDTGSPQENWVTVQLTVSNGGADRVVAFKPIGETNFTTVSTIIGGVGSAAAPCIGYADFFSSVNTNQWGIFDNILIDDLTPAASASDWYMYE